MALPSVQETHRTHGWAVFAPVLPNSPNLMAPIKTGWPPPPLMQDDDRKLFRWFASRLDARRLVREAAERIEKEREAARKTKPA